VSIRGHHCVYSIMSRTMQIDLHYCNLGTGCTQVQRRHRPPFMATGVPPKHELRQTSQPGGAFKNNKAISLTEENTQITSALENDKNRVDATTKETERRTWHQGSKPQAPLDATKSECTRENRRNISEKIGADAKRTLAWIFQMGLSWFE